MRGQGAVDDARPSLDPGIALLGTLAVLLAVAYLGYLLAAAPEVGAGQRLLEAAVGLAMPAALAVGTYRLRRLSLDATSVWRVAMWSLGGVSALTLLTAWGFYVDSLGTGLRPEPMETLLLNVQAGAVAGLVVGVYDARAQRYADRATAARDQYRLLNQLLRHNILNSVQLVDSYVETYRRGGTDEETMLDTVQNQATAIEGLVEKARVLEESTEEGDAVEAVDVAEAVRQQVEVFDSSYPDATFETDVPDAATAVADPLVDAVIENLLSNAVEHNDQPAPTVRTSVQKDGRRVELLVEDDGPGVSDRMKETLFEYEESGTPHGLGLYLVDTLVDRYGGDVDIEDVDPRGTRVRVRLRAASATEDHAEVRA